MQVTAATQILTTYCTEAMQSKLRSLDDFDTKVKLDPVEMLKRIKAIVCEGSTREHETLQVIKQLKIALSPQMGDHETLPQYCRRVDTNVRQVFESDGIGWEFLYKSIRETQAYKDAKDPDKPNEVSPKQKATLWPESPVSLVSLDSKEYNQEGLETTRNRSRQTLPSLALTTCPSPWMLCARL